MLYVMQTKRFNVAMIEGTEFQLEVKRIERAEAKQIITNASQFKISLHRLNDKHIYRLGMNLGFPVDPFEIEGRIQINKEDLVLLFSFQIDYLEWFQLRITGIN